MNSLGRHILVELFECNPEILNDVTSIEKSMLMATREAGAMYFFYSFHCYLEFITAVSFFCIIFMSD